MLGIISVLCWMRNMAPLKNLSCPEGDGVILKQGGFDPTCEDQQTGPRGVVEITKASCEELEQKVEMLRRQIQELEELERKVEMLRQRVQELDAEDAVNKVLTLSRSDFGNSSSY